MNEREENIQILTVKRLWFILRFVLILNIFSKCFLILIYYFVIREIIVTI